MTARNLKIIFTPNYYQNNAGKCWSPIFHHFLAMQMSKCHLATVGQTTEFCVNRDKATGNAWESSAEDGAG